MVVRGKKVLGGLGDGSGSQAVVDRSAMGRVDGVGRGDEFGLLQDLLRVLPDLRGVRLEREPKTDQIGLLRKQK